MLLVPAVGIFCIPGWLIGRIFKTPFEAITPFLGSAALLFNLILVLDALGLPLNLPTIGCGMAAITAVLALWAIRRGAHLGVGAKAPAWPVGTEWVWLIPPVLALASIAARTWIEPLAGYDNAFRWDYLARLILAHHSISSYPPVSMADFDLYAWCDGIPPLVPFLNYLVYAVAGSVAPRLISLRPVVEFLLLAMLTFRFARGVWGGSAGWASLAVLGSSALFTWGLSIEQETGLTALGLVAMVYFLRAPRQGEEASPSSLSWAGVAAGIGAISREYGLYFVILGALLLVLDGRGRSLLRFLLPAIAVAAPWYVRNWIKTGNPVFPGMGSVFPTNPVHVEIMRDIASFLGFRSAAVSLDSVPWVLLATSGAVWILGAAGVIRLRFRTGGIFPALLLVIALWIWSMPQTAGAWNYSMRVLLPSLVLGSILGAWIGTARFRVIAAVLLALLSLDSGRRAWMLPDFPFATPWTFSFAEWRALHAQNEDSAKSNIWPVLAQAAAGRYIVVDSPQAFIGLTDAGGHPAPLMSPRVGPAFDPSLTVDEALRRLRALNVRMVTFSVANPVVNRLVQRHATFRALARDYQPVANVNGLLIYDLEFLSRKPAAH